jgi:hypothetical protein
MDAKPDPEFEEVEETFDRFMVNLARRANH